MRIRAGAGVFFGALGVFVATTLAAGALTGTFTVVDPPAAAHVVFAEDINDAGQITGGSTFTEGGSTHAYLREADGTYTDLDPTLPSTTTSRGNALNNAGDVVGVSGLIAALWPAAGGGPIPLGTLAGDTESVASDINDAGVIVGSSYTDATTRAFVRDPADGLMVDMGTLPGGIHTQVEAINDAGVATGWVRLAPFGVVGFTWTEAAGMVPMPYPPGAVAFRPTAINDAGQVVGNSEFVERRAFVWDPIDGYTELTMDGHLTSIVSGISDTGLAVGTAQSPGAAAATWDLANGEAATFDVFETTGMTSHLVSVNNSGMVLGISFDGEDFGPTFVGQIGRNPPTAAPPPAPPPAEPVAAAPSFTG